MMWPWIVRFGSLLLCILKKKKRQDSLTSVIWNSALWYNEQSTDSTLSVLLRDDCFAFLFLQQTKNILTLHTGWWCKVFPHRWGYSTDSDWWTSWESGWPSNVQEFNSTRNPSTDRKLCQQHQRSVSNLLLLRRTIQECCTTQLFCGFSHLTRARLTGLAICFCTCWLQQSPNVCRTSRLQKDADCDLGTDQASDKLQSYIWLINCRSTFMRWVTD